MAADCRDIRLEAVTGDLNYARDAGSQVRNKVVCVLIIPLAGQVRDNQFRAAVNSKEREKVTAKLVAWRCPALAQSDSRPKFVKLDGFGFDVADNLIMEAFGLPARSCC